MRRFAAWLVEEGEIGADPFDGVKPPKIDEDVIEPLNAEELRAMISACQVPRDTRPEGGVPAPA